MSEIVEQIREQVAYYNRTDPLPSPAERREQRELAKERERKAREAREAEEKQQAASTNWYAAVDGRINEHLKNWLWGSIDDRITQHIDRHEDIFKLKTTAEWQAISTSVLAFAWPSQLSIPN